MVKAVICEIEKYAIHDGPGIRSVVFLKGCPLTCLWCANPETQRKENELYYNLHKCIQCRRCIKACGSSTLSLIEKGIQIDRESCTLCGECIRACPMKALIFVGKTMSVEEVFEEVSKDTIFYQQSGGGITISGGEILLHEEFVTALLKKCKENYMNTAIETSGFGSWNSLDNIAQYCDLIMFDIKHTDSNLHKRLTGVEHKSILQNLYRLSKVHSNIIIRVPLITGLNDSEENIKKIVEIAKENSIKEIHVLPYHSLGREKYRQLGRPYSLDTIKSPDDERIKKLKEHIEQSGLHVIVGG